MFSLPEIRKVSNDDETCVSIDKFNFLSCNVLNFFENIKIVVHDNDLG